MSYTPTPNDQLLGPSLEKTLEGIDTLDAAIMARHRDRREWNEDHLEEILALSVDLRHMQARLRKLMNETR